MPRGTPRPCNVPPMVMSRKAFRRKRTDRAKCPIKPQKRVFGQNSCHTSSAAADSDLLSLVHPRDTYPSTWSAAKLDREALRSRTASTQLSGISSRSVIVGKSWESELHSADGDLTCSTLRTIDAHRPFDTSSPIVTLVTTLPLTYPTSLR